VVVSLAVLVGGCAEPPPETTTTFQQVPDHGGLVLRTPSIVTITFDDDPDAETMQDFADWIVGSDWLAATGGEYGIGPGTNQRVHRSAVDANVTDRDLQHWLADSIHAGDLPEPGASAAPRLYVWLLGPSAHMTNPDGSCVGGYHDEMTIGSQRVPYIVVPSCPGETVHGLTPVQYRQGRTSHELIETFTDALPTSAPAYVFRDAGRVWTSTYGEVGDLCVWNYLPFVAPSGATFYAQRSWSNAAAALGGDPCVPRPAGLAYFNVRATPAFASAKRGDTVTVTLDGWTAEAPHDPWSIHAQRSAWGDFDASPVLSSQTISDGGSATVTLHVPMTAAAGQRASIAIISDDSVTNSLWPIAVVVRDAD
jgi:hypothetical protein